MKLFIYIEPTSYLMLLLRQLKHLDSGSRRIIFLRENLTQKWDIELQDVNDMEILRGGAANIYRLWHLMTNQDVELLHLAGWGHPILIIAMLLARILAIPITVESDTIKYVGIPRWKRALKRLFYPLLFKMPAMFLPGGSRQAEYLRFYGVPDNRIKVAQMTVDTTGISAYINAMDSNRKVSIRASYDVPSDGIIFLYVGRLEPHKGLIELISAFERISLTENRLAYLLIVGDGSLSDVIIEKSAQQKYIRYAGRLSGSALFDAYAVADVFILVSRFEPWGLVINEAMAAGLPVVVTECLGCVDDLVIQGETGLVIPIDSEEMLVKAMESLFFNQKLREEMAQNARNLISGWTLENEANIVVNAWEKILKG